MERPRRRGMGRTTHLRRVCGPSLQTALAMLVALLGVLVAAAPAAAAPPLAQRLATALAAPGLDPSRSAALAVDVRTGAVVFSHNPDLSLQPASNEKLAVAYASLRLLGPAYRLRTEVAGSGALVDGTWRGDLYLEGHGDPTLREADLADLARQVAEWGIVRVTGAVIGDESWYDAHRTAPGWKGRFYIGESPPLSALIAERGRYRGTTSDNPALAAASLFRQALAEAGVEVAKRSLVGVAPAEAFPLALDFSEPLADIVRFMGRESDNFTAELLVKELGRTQLGAGTTGAGARVMRDALAGAEVPLAGVRLADGSGLSLLDRLTARALVALLVAAAADPELRDAFLTSLPVAGVNGTLADRMERRPARGRVRAKTGTTNGASALSGFAGRYVFAIVQNGSPVPYWIARRAQDRFATVLAAG
jgi:D-alanyl-D-alanine carboxypeptidase/D-alanyl-D-alanine-endopeptidase (penicillin-binding protein 4)